MQKPSGKKDQSIAGNFHFTDLFTEQLIINYYTANAIVSFQKLRIALVLRTRAILIVFEKLTRACFFPNCT